MHNQTYFPAILFLAEDNNQITGTADSVNHGKPFVLELASSKLREQIRDFLKPGFLPTKQLHATLINPIWYGKHTCTPSSVVLIPDWLIDVTRICQDLTAPHDDVSNTILQRYFITEPSPPLLSGNICHATAAYLAAFPNADFTAVTSHIFRLFGLQLAVLTEMETESLVITMKHQFSAIQTFMQNADSKYAFTPEDLIVEPTFLCPALGMQGRPDFITVNSNKLASVLLELKSGKSFNPSGSFLPVHRIQTTLYREMMDNQNKGGPPEKTYILYTADNVPKALLTDRHPDALPLSIISRNAAVYMDLKMTTPEGHAAVFEEFTSPKRSNLPKFLSTKAEHLINMYQKLTPLEKAYWHYHGASIHKEHLLVRIGDETSKGGQNMIWTASTEQKLELTRIIPALRIQNIIQQPDFTSVVFHNPADKEKTTPFRIGDIALLYPYSGLNQSFSPGTYLFRGSITGTSTNSITVKLRTPQHNLIPFQKKEEWCIESDALDSSFRQLYHGLTALMSAPPLKRQQIMGLIPPDKAKPGREVEYKNNLSAHQKKIVHQALNACDYYLIWGPPGTGKTNMIISELTFQILQNQQEPLLLLAYTNKAVDELCHSILAIDPSFSSHLLRIGSTTSSENRYHSFILDNQLKSCRKRKEIIDLIKSKRIIVSTLSSMYHKQELFRLLSIHTVIIDEASQVTEPLMTSILARCKKWILVGDHMQLPAVALRNIDDSKIDDPILRKAGFLNTQTSLFERLFLQVTKNQWHHAFGMLYEQGRMHTELMSFPNKEFYQSSLEVMPGLLRQKTSLLFKNPPRWASVMQHRKIAIHVESDQKISQTKTSTDEANACFDCVRLLKMLHEKEGNPLQSNRIGIISPFRSQASLINQTLVNASAEIANLIHADTIERFQGSTRDVVIISFGLQHTSLLDSITSRTSAGADRKMNVALTRARDQIIIIANTKILNQNPAYARLLSEYKKISLEQLKYMVQMDVNSRMSSQALRCP